jgi:hypothetical protein
MIEVFKYKQNEEYEFEWWHIIGRDQVQEGRVQKGASSEWSMIAVIKHT